MPLRENVQACADKYGISIRKLEQQLHIANKSISTWNEHRPSVDKVCAVADFFGVSVDWLLDRQDSLTDNETALIALFRRLSESHRKDLIQIAESFAVSDAPAVIKAKAF